MYARKSPGANRPYPYGFLDVGVLGIGRVIVNAVAIAAGVLVLGYAAYLTDRLRARKAA